MNWLCFLLLTYQASGGPPVKNRAVPFQIHAHCSFSTDESPGLGKAFEAFRCRCESCSSFLHQWDNENYCSWSSIWRCTDEGSAFSSLLACALCGFHFGCCNNKWIMWIAGCLPINGIVVWRYSGYIQQIIWEEGHDSWNCVQSQILCHHVGFGMWSDDHRDVPTLSESYKVECWYSKSNVNECTF